MYNQSEDQYQGFMDFRTSIDVREDSNKDKLVPEALVFMCVGQKGQ